MWARDREWKGEREWKGILRPHKVDSQIIITCRHAILKKPFIIQYLSSISNIVNAKNTCFSTVFNLASRNYQNHLDLSQSTKRLPHVNLWPSQAGCHTLLLRGIAHFDEWPMNNDRPPAWNIGIMVTIICKFTLWGLTYIWSLIQLVAPWCCAVIISKADLCCCSIAKSIGQVSYIMNGSLFPQKWPLSSSYLHASLQYHSLIPVLYDGTIVELYTRFAH